jgi:hypothetical protein
MILYRNCFEEFLIKPFAKRICMALKLIGVLMKRGVSSIVGEVPKKSSQ